MSNSNKPESLRSVLRKQIESMPRLFLAELLSERARELAIALPTDEAEKMAAAILRGEQGPFAVAGLEPLDAKIVLKEADIRAIAERLEEFSQHHLPEIVKETVEKGAEVLIKKLVEGWPERHAWEEGDLHGFRERLKIRWGKALVLLRLLLSMSREVGEDYLQRLSRSRAKTGIAKRQVLLGLHSRACQVATEIVVLLENGLSDGAMTRWRTLYEIGVVTSLIDRVGDEIAVRFLDHSSVTRKDELENDLRLYGSGFYSEAAKKRVLLEYDAVVSRYGKEFSRPYGWAAYHIGKERPTFQDVERAAGFQWLPSTFKIASYKVHSGVAGVYWHIGSLNDGPALMPGSSNAGLEVPGVNTAFTLTHITCTLFMSRINLESQMKMLTLIKVRDRVEKEFDRAAKKLRRDHKAVGSI